MKVIVTGAAGLTGKEIVRLAVADRHEVTAVVRRAPQLGRLHPAAVVVLADCTDPAAMERVLTPGGVLVHVAGIRVGAQLARIPGLQRLAGVVAISSAGIYSRHQPSATEYRSNEDALNVAHPRVVIVRPTMIYGAPDDRNVHHVISFAQRYGFLPVVGQGTARIQPIHYVDLATAVARLLKHPSAVVVDAGGADLLTMKHAGQLIFEALGRSPRFVAVPHALAMSAATALDVVRGSRWRERVARAVEDRTVDVRALKELTGVTLRPFAEGVKEEVAALRELWAASSP